MESSHQNTQSKILSEVITEGGASTVTKQRNHEENNTKQSFTYLQLKDSGYAWFILAAMFVSNALSVGYIKGFGIIYNSIADNYPTASGTMAGVMMGLLSGCRSIFSPLTGSIANWIGIRKTMFLGASIYCISLLLSFYCTSVIQLSITLGAMVGLSQCILDSCQVILMPHYFESKLSLANGIRVAGNPFGGILYPVMLTSLLYFYDLGSFFIILSAITSHLFVCAFMMRPIRVHIKIKTLDKVNKILKSESQFEECRNLLNIEENLFINDKNKYYNNKNIPISNFHLINVKEENNLKQTKFGGNFNVQYNLKKNIYDKIINENNISNTKTKKSMDYKFLKNPHYICFLLMASGIPMGLPLVLYYMTLYAKTSVGMSPYEITVLLSIQAVFDFLLRIFVGWLNNKNLYKKSHGFMFCLWCSALATVLMPLGKNLMLLLLFVLIYSLGPASFHCFTTVLLCEQFGKENIASTWGFVRMTQGIFSFIHPIVIGFALDWSGSYTVPFLIMGFGLFVCGVSMGIEPLLKKHSTSS